MTNRSKFVKEIFENGRNKTWEEYAIDYGFRDAKQANDYYRWFIKNGAIEDCWEPSLKAEIQPEPLETYQEQIQEDVVGSVLWQEFLDFKASKRKDDFIPGQHVIIPCLHAPFHNKELLESCLALIADIKPQGLHILGDFLDMNSLSFHDKGNVPIPGITLEYEYQEGRKILERIDSAADFKKKTYIFGNHEDRYGRHMAKGDNAKYGGALESPIKALGLREKGFEVQDNWQQGVIYLGKYLELCHGSYFNVFSAKKHIDVYRTSVMYCHTHRIQQYIEGNVGGYNIGWMGDASTAAFNYASRGMKEAWNNGFAIVTIDENGYYFVDQLIWQNNRFYYGGKKY